MILRNLWRVFYLVVIPVVRGFISALSGGLTNWLSGAWLDMMIFSLMIAISVLQWANVEFRYDEQQLLVRSGVVVWRETRIPWHNVVTLSVIRPFYLKPLGAVRLRADTLGGDFREDDFSILLTPRNADEVLRFHRERQVPREGRSYSPSTRSIAAMSLLNSNSFAGIVFIATFVYQAGRLLGRTFSDRLLDTFEEFTRTLAFGLPPAATALALVLLGGWLVGFLLTFVRYKNLLISRTDTGLLISGGMFTQRRYDISYRDINFIDIRQSLTTKILGLYSLYISAVGYGKNKDDISCIIPTENRVQFTRIRQLLFETFLPADRALRPPFTGIMRFLTDPLWPCLGFLLAGLALVWVAPAWRSFVLFVTLMAMIPSLMFLAVRLVDFFTGGLALTRDEQGKMTLTMRYSKGFSLHTVVVPIEQIVQVRIDQGFWQRLGGKSCDVVVLTTAEGRSTHHCRSLKREEALRLFSLVETR